MYNEDMIPARRPFLRVLYLAVLLSLVVSAVPQSSIQPAPRAAATLTLVAPAACPAAGCAAGQRLSYRLDFELGLYTVDTSTTDPNLKICAYAPNGWTDPALTVMDTTGLVTAQTYTPAVDTDPDPAIDTRCAQDTMPPAGYSLIAANEADFNGYYFFESLGLSLRISSAASASGNILLRVFERGASGWTRSQQVFTPLTAIAPAASPAYVAATAATCDAAAAKPCYLNSGGDLPSGIGTGLRDAVDAASPNAIIRLLGSYPVKGSAVTIHKPVTLEGQGAATLTTEGSQCANPLLDITNGAPIRNLTITDGTCASPNRSLLAINNSPAEVLIESNTLTGGADAVTVTNTNSAVTIRSNDIRANSGYALLWNGGSGALNLLANNIAGNRSGDPVECGLGETAVVANRKIDHNYWGGAAVPGAATHCASKANKQLGAPVAKNANGAGVQVARVTVTTNKTFYFDNQIAVQRSSDGSDYPLYIVNHGTPAPDGIPFTGWNAGSPNPCSNAFDVFLSDGAAVGSSLTLTLRYDRSSACVAAIDSSYYCEQNTNTARYPLWWYHPSGVITAGWDTTGQNPAGTSAGGVSGQETSCDMVANEIKVVLDNSGRPNLSDDLNYTPFMIGVGIPATFVVLASDKTVTVQWTTTSEADISGFYVERSLQSDTGFGPISDLIQRKGSALAGSSYTFTDGGRTNGITNYYRLRIVRSDGGYFYSDVLSIIPNVATITPTPTASATTTPRPSPSVTPTRTATFGFFPSATRLPTSTPRPSVILRTATPTRTFGAIPSLTPGASQPGQPGGYPAPGEDTPGPGGEELSPTVSPSATKEEFTMLTVIPTNPVNYSSPTPTRTTTPSPTPDPGQKMRETSNWVSLVMGLLLSSGLVGLFAWMFFRRRKPNDPEEPNNDR